MIVQAYVELGAMGIPIPEIAHCETVFQVLVIVILTGKELPVDGLSPIANTFMIDKFEVAPLDAEFGCDFVKGAALVMQRLPNPFAHPLFPGAQASKILGGFGAIVIELQFDPS